MTSSEQRERVQTTAFRLPRTAPLALGGLGGILILHPWYFDTLTVYPNGGWGFLPLFHATITTLGLLFLLAAVQYRGVGFLTIHQAGAIAFLAVVMFAVYDQAILPMIGPYEGVVPAYGVRKLVVSGLVAWVFILGGTIVTRNAASVRLAILSLLPLLVLTWVDWGLDPLLGPVLDLWFLLSGAPILGLPFLGLFLFMMAVLLGISACRDSG